MTTPSVDELIRLAEASRHSPDVPAAEQGLYERIVAELHRIKRHPEDDFSPVLSRSLIDGSWETPFFKPFNVWLGEHRRRIRSSRR